MSDFSAVKWELDRFGRAADELRDRIPAALQAAHSRARAAYIGAALSSNDAYGGPLWLIQHEELVAHTAGLGKVIRPPRSRYELRVVNGVVLYPWRYASDRTALEEAQLRKPVSGVRRSLFDALASDVPAPLPTLFDDQFDEAAEVPPVADEFDPQYARLVLVAYASNPQSGILAIRWGEADLLDDGRLRWGPHYPLPLQPPQADAGRVAGTGSGPTPPIRPVRPAGPAAGRRFDDAPLDEPVLGRQTPGVPPPAEPEPNPSPTGSDQDG